MSVEQTSVDGVSTTDSPDSPLARSANYMACRRCGEGSLVYDPEREASRCSSCGELE